MNIIVLNVKIVKNVMNVVKIKLLVYNMSKTNQMNSIKTKNVQFVKNVLNVLIKEIIYVMNAEIVNV